MSVVSADLVNTISYISHLNLDSLRAIFALVADEDRPDPTHPSAEKCWMKIGHVCRLWRSVLLDMPLLWGRDLCVFGVNGPFEDILARTQDAPLHIVFRPNLPDYTLCRIAPLISRARVLRCTIQSPEDYQAIIQALASRLPALNILAVTLDPWISIFDEALLDPVPFAYDSPVTQLMMNNLVVHPPLNGCLTSLTINLSQMERKKRFLLDDIVEVLLHNLALESLHLTHALRARNAGADLRRLCLPALSHFTMRQDLAAVSSFDLIRLLQLPAVTCLHIADGFVDTAAQITEALACTLRCCSGSPILALPEFSLNCIRGGCDDASPYLDIELYPAWDLGLPSKADADASFRLGLFSDHGRELSTATEMLITALKHLSEAKISDRAVELLWYPWLTEADSIEYWDVVLPHFPVLSDLLVEGTTEGLTALFNALSQCEESPRLLSRLTRLTIEQVDGFDGFPWSAHFEQMFRRRMAVGSPIREIRLKGLNKPRRQAMMPRYTAVTEQMERLAESLGVEMVTQEWRGVEEIIGTAFEFQY